MLVKKLVVTSIVLMTLGVVIIRPRSILGQFGAMGEAIPVARVMRGDLDLKVYTMGVLAATRTAMLVAPPIGGGALQIVRLTRTGAHVKAGEVVIEFDPSEQEFNLEQSRSDLMQAEQEIAKAKADAAVQAAQDQVALLKAKFDVRQAELDVSRNELVSAIDAKKNLLKLDEAKRALAQLQQDMKSHAASSDATLAVNEEKQNKAQLAMQQAQRNIENMQVRAPISGLVQIEQNRDAAGGFFFTGMTLPDYRQGDQVQPGRFVAQILDTDQMEIQAKINEGDRANLNPGQPVRIDVDALPGETFTGKVKSVAGMASSNMWGGDTTSRFDAAFQFDKPDPRLRPGLTAHLVILGKALRNVLYVPRQAVFEKNGDLIVYLKSGARFNPQQVKVEYQTESRVVIEGLKQGAEVALVDPEGKARQQQKNTEPLSPAAGGGRL